MDWNTQIVFWIFPFGYCECVYFLCKLVLKIYEHAIVECFIVIRWGRMGFKYDYALVTKHCTLWIKGGARGLGCNVLLLGNDLA
jgi:hypothetical protein